VPSRYQKIRRISGQTHNSRPRLLQATAGNLLTARTTCWAGHVRVNALPSGNVIEDDHLGSELSRAILIEVAKDLADALGNLWGA
jgi:hypothetical protein